MYDAYTKFSSSDIGVDNELLTRGNKGNAAWLASVQKTNGRCRGHHSELQPVPQPKSKGRGASRKVRPAAEYDDEDIIDDDDEMEMAELRKPKAKPKSKSGRR